MSDPEEPRTRDLVVAVVQMEARQAWADADAVSANAEAIGEAYVEASDRADLVVFPELALSGYIPLKGYDQRRKRNLASAARRAATEELPKLADHTRGRRAALVLGFMEPTTMRNEIHNAVALIENGELRAVYRKMHLPVEENHYFVPGDDVVVVDAAAGRVGLLACYDLLFPEAARIAALRGAEVLVVPSNWLDIGNLRRLGEVLPVARALEEQMHVVFVNGVGELGARGRRWRLYGRSLVVAATGEVVARAGSDEETLIATLPGSDLAAASDVFPVLRDRRPELYGALVESRSELSALGDLQGGEGGT